MKPISSHIPAAPPAPKPIPPGIAKKEQQLPPGMLQRLEALPKGIEARFPRPEPTPPVSPEQPASPPVGETHSLPEGVDILV